MGLHVWDLEWRFLVSPLQRFSEAGAGLLGGQSVPEWPRLAPGSSNICLPSSHSSGQQPALCGAGVVMLVGLLSLLRAEVSTVARLSFVSCVSQDSFFFSLLANNQHPINSEFLNVCSSCQAPCMSKE